MKPFLLLAELVPAQTDDVRPIERFLRDYANRRGSLPPGVRLAGITLPQNPRGIAMLDPADVFTLIAARKPASSSAPSGAIPAAASSPADSTSRGLWTDLDVIPHITGKEQNAEALRSTLLGFRALGLTTVLAVTGDKPDPGKRVFELDSIGLLRLISGLNFDAYQRAPLKVLAEQPAPSGPKPPSLADLLAGRTASFSPAAGFASIPQFFALAAVSPFKYTEASLIQQYFKLGKKIRAGAGAILTQMGWDSWKSEELFRYLRDARIPVPIFGNVFFLTTANQAARLMHDGQMPGCYVSDELLADVRRGKAADHLERAAAQVAMYRDLGAAGVDLGGLTDFDLLLKIVARAGEIGSGWRERREILDYPPRRLASGAAPFYLYGPPAGPSKGSSAGSVDASASPAAAGYRPAPRPRKLHQKYFDFLHRNFLTKGRCLNPAVTAAAGAFTSLKRGDGVLYHLVHGAENATKSFLFKCEDCGDCFLPENFGYCTLGECEKGLSNPPCGDATPDGFCGNNVKRVCVAELIYNAAAAAIVESRDSAETVPPPASTPGLARLAAASLPPRLPGLANTSAVLNYLFDRDHARTFPLIQIAELLHASIPRTAAAMNEVIAAGLIRKRADSPVSSGPAAVSSAADSPATCGPAEPDPADTGTAAAALGYLVSLIKMQVRHGAAYIDVNVDALSEDDLEFRKEILRFFVRLIWEHSSGVPVCVDSSSTDLLETGLETWYGAGPNPPVPLLNSVKTYTMDRLLPLRPRFPFRFIGLLVDAKTAGRDGAYGVDELRALAGELFSAATGKYGFAPGDIFFDSTVFPLSIDVPMNEEKPGYTYRAFETIRRLKADPAFKGAHFSLGVTNSVRNLPGRRTGVARAYLARAMERGLDAAIVNVFHDYGRRPPAPDLLAFVDAFASQDGSPAAVQRAIDAMMDFCRANRGK